MSIFDYLKRWLGNSDQPPVCPNCGFEHGWNGARCTHCQYPEQQRHIPEPGSLDQPSTTNQAQAQPASSGQPSQAALGDMSAGKFAPISVDDALQQTQGADWKTAYWDSTGVIPPADLPRIQLINQTMVGLGLISSAELEHIHAIGEKFNQFRSNDQTIEVAGERAVQRDRAERQRIKQQKKQEAAKRKEAHREAVAHRRATDIVYLGRGVSQGLANRQSNVEKLEQLGLPIMATPAELAKQLGLEVPRLRWLAFHSDAARRIHYVHFTVPKKSGGQRRLSAPHQKMSAAQRWVLENIVSQLSPHDAAHGFAMGRSTVTNAQPHVGADEVINLDLKNFFPSVNFHRVLGWFQSLGYSPAVATILGLLCTEAPRQPVKLNGQVYYAAVGPRSLPQGACTSPSISNLIARHLDQRLQGMANKLGWSYTRYADDITFSWRRNGSTNESQTGYVLGRIRHIVDDEGFQVNEAKTRVLRNHTRQSVTGIVVNDRPGIDRPTVRRLRAILHNAERDGLAAQNREDRPDFIAWLNGMISYVEMVNRRQGAKLRASFDRALRRSREPG